MTDSISKLSKAADEHGPSAFLMGLGATLLILPVLAAVHDPAGGPLLHLRAGEMVAIIAASVLFLLTGAMMRVYWLKVQVDAAKAQRETGAEMLKEITDAATGLAGTQLPSGRPGGPAI